MMSSKRSHYFLYLNSNDSTDFYPNNEPADFRTQLPRPLTLDGEWECALVSITFWPQFHTSEKPKEMYVCLEEVGNSYALDSLYPILKRVSVPENIITKVHLNYPHLDFTTVTQTVLQSIRLYIIDNKGIPPAFMIKDLYCTLLLRRKNTTTRSDGFQ
jgi:hypothetical protein